jgi:hypothetical protein
LERIEAWAADFGGLEAMSAIEYAQLEQAGRLTIRAEGEKDAAVAVKLTSESRRLLAALRKRKAAPTTPKLEEYLARQGAPAS